MALGLALGILLSDTGALVGQDLSERTVQPAVPVPQFSLGKPFPGSGPIGPRLVTLNELPDRGDLRLCRSVDGRVLQDGPTRDMILSARELVARIYAACLILPGDALGLDLFDPPAHSDNTNHQNQVTVGHLDGR